MKYYGPHVKTLHRRKLGGDGYVCGLCGGHGFTGKYLFPKSLRCRYSLCMNFMSIILNKLILKRKKICAVLDFIEILPLESHSFGVNISLPEDTGY